jgi:hypothetical protein
VKVVIKSNVGLANRVVPMSLACKAIGMSDVDYGSSGAKIDCPFDTLFHLGGGKSFRIYDDVSAYCYACGERYLPVQLYSIAKDVSLEDAAEFLLELSGHKELSADERYAEAASSPVRIDQSALEMALKTFCARNFDSWDVTQFDIPVARKYRQCVELLPSVRTAEDTKIWLAAAKSAMTKVLGEAE